MANGGLGELVARCEQASVNFDLDGFTLAVLRRAARSRVFPLDDALVRAATSRTGPATKRRFHLSAGLSKIRSHENNPVGHHWLRRRY